MRTSTKTLVMLALLCGLGSRARAGDDLDNEKPPLGPPNVEVEAPRPSPMRQPAGSAVRRAKKKELPKDPMEELLLRSAKGVTFGTMLDELVDELLHQISREDPKPFSPLALRLVRVSPNLRPEIGEAVEAKIVSRLAKLPNLEQVVCLECRAVRSRVEGDDWVVSLGATRQADLRRLGEELGAKAFMEVDLHFNQMPAELTLSAKVYRASDAHVVWATAIRGDETTASILRTGKVPPSREEQLMDLKQKLEQRPRFGYMVFLGFLYMSSDSPRGGYPSANLGIRLYERFGADRRHMFGIQGEGVIDWARDHSLYGGIISAGYWYGILKPNLNRPELRIGVTGGGFIAGTEGNSAVFQAMFEAVLKFRLAFNVSALYMVPAQYDGYDLGGFGAAARFAFNW